jgi:hypothetical protein
VVGWLQQWPAIERLIYLLFPEMAHSVICLLGDMIATVPVTLHAAAEYHWQRRAVVAKKHRLLMQTTLKPPTA